MLRYIWARLQSDLAIRITKNMKSKLKKLLKNEY